MPWKVAAVKYIAPEGCRSISLDHLFTFQVSENPSDFLPLPPTAPLPPLPQGWVCLYSSKVSPLPPRERETGVPTAQ